MSDLGRHMAAGGTAAVEQSSIDDAVMFDGIYQHCRVTRDISTTANLRTLTGFTMLGEMEFAFDLQAWEEAESAVLISDDQLAVKLLDHTKFGIGNVTGAFFPTVADLRRLARACKAGFLVDPQAASILTSKDGRLASRGALPLRGELEKTVVPALYPVISTKMHHYTQVLDKGAQAALARFCDLDRRIRSTYLEEAFELAAGGGFTEPPVSKAVRVLLSEAVGDVSIPGAGATLSILRKTVVCNKWSACLRKVALTRASL